MSKRMPALVKKVFNIVQTVREGFKGACVLAGTLRDLVFRHRPRMECEKTSIASELLLVIYIDICVNA